MTGVVMRKLALSLVAVTLLSGPAYSATYYVAPNGDDIKGNGSISNPWKTLNKLGTTLQAGDTGICRGGTYTETNDRLHFVGSGSRGSPITVKNHPGETPVFRAQGSIPYGYGGQVVRLRNWIVIEGLEFRPLNYANRIEYTIQISGDYNIVRNVVADHVVLTSGSHSGDYATEKAVWIDPGADHNEISTCTFSRGGDLRTGYPTGSGGGIIRVWGNYNVIHDNILQRGVHEVIDFIGNYNEAYSNTIEHAIGYGFQVTGSRNIIEGNIITGSDEDMEYVKNPIYIGGSHNIIRYNRGYNNEIYGYDRFGSGIDNVFYNNVFYNNGSDGFHGWVKASGDKHYNNVIAHNMTSRPLCVDYYAEIVETAGYDARWENNWIVAHDGTDWQMDSPCAVFDGTFKSVSKKEMEDPDWKNNIYNYSDPQFVDPDTGDFRIRSGSSLIDRGRDLTHAIGSGSGGTSLRVDEADFFWHGDHIVIGATTIRRVSSIDYGSDTITLSSGASWSDGDPVNVYKTFNDADAIRFAGSAPDIGAFEYDGTDPSDGQGDSASPGAPKGLMIVGTPAGGQGS
jgi:hypothetical protein